MHGMWILRRQKMSLCTRNYCTWHATLAPTLQLKSVLFRYVTWNYHSWFTQNQYFSRLPSELHWYSLWKDSTLRICSHRYGSSIFEDNFIIIFTIANLVLVCVYYLGRTLLPTPAHWYHLNICTMLFGVSLLVTFT